MLENLRAMGVFASVVHNGSFSGAARELGITTSAVSQQIRALEEGLDVVLLHRSTRKLSLTEAGACLYESAKSIVGKAEEACDQISRLRDELLGNLRIATTPKLAREYVLPALSDWISKHGDLSLHIFTDNEAIDVIDERMDLLLYFSYLPQDGAIFLTKVEQILVASPKWLEKNRVDSPKDLSYQRFILPSSSDQLRFRSGETVKTYARFTTNDEELALSLTKEGYGIMRTNAVYAHELLSCGKLVQVLPAYELPTLMLYAKTPSQNRQPEKVRRCLQVLMNHFGQSTTLC